MDKVDLKDPKRCPFCRSTHGICKWLRQCTDCGTQLNWPGDDVRQVWGGMAYYKWENGMWRHRSFAV